MYFLYTDETNLEERDGDFFVYAGVAIDGSKALALSKEIEAIRSKSKVDKSFKLKFNPKPDHLSHQDFISLKQEIIAACVGNDCRLLVSVILHNIAKSPAVARLNGINTICFHFDCFLIRKKDAGLVLVDRFSDSKIDAHLVEKMAIGLTGMPYSSELKLSNLVGVHYAAVGQSHFSSVVDIVLGSLRFSLNAFTRGDGANLPTAKKLLAMLQPMFFREDEGKPVSEISLCFSPKIIKVNKYREQYQALKDFLADNGIGTQQIIGGT